MIVINIYKIESQIPETVFQKSIGSSSSQTAKHKNPN